MKPRNKYYRVEEFVTTGWEVSDPRFDCKLSKQAAKERLDYYLGEGISPDRLRAVYDEDGKYSS